MATPFTLADGAVAVSADLRQYDADLKKAEQSGTGSGSRLADALKRDFGGASKVLATTVGGLFGLALKGGNDLTEAMARYRAETGATAQETAEVQKQTSELFRTNLEGFDIIAGVQARVRTQLGLTGKAQKEATQLVLDYARATGQDAVEAVGTLDDLTDGYNLTAAQQVDILDKLKYSQEQYGASVQDNQAALIALAPALKAANLSYDDGIGLLNLFAKSGVDAAVAATAMTKALSQVKSPEELKRLIADIQATADPLERAQKASDLFGVKAGPKLALALSQGTLGLGEFAVSTDEATAAVKKASDAIESTPLNWLKLQLKNLVGPLADVAAGIGPIATGLVGIGTLAGSLGLDGFVKKIVGTMAEAGKAGGEAFIDASSTAVGALGTIIGNLIANALDPTNPLLGNPIRRAGAAAGQLWGRVFGAASALADKVTEAILGLPKVRSLVVGIESVATELGTKFGTKFGVAAALGVALFAPEILDAITPHDAQDIASRFGADWATSLTDASIDELRKQRAKLQVAYVQALTLPSGFDPLRGVKQLFGPDNIFGATPEQDLKRKLDDLDALIARWQADHQPHVNVPVEIAGPPIPRIQHTVDEILNGASGAIHRGSQGPASPAMQLQRALSLQPSQLVEMSTDARLGMAGIILAAAAGIRSRRGNVDSAIDQLREDMKNRLTPKHEAIIRIGQLVSKLLVKGLNSGDPQAKHQAEGTRSLIEDALVRSIQAGGTPGEKIMNKLERDLNSKDPKVRRQAERTKGIIDKALKGQTGPPTPSPGDKIGSDLASDLKGVGGIVGLAAYQLGLLIAKNLRAGVHGSGPVGGGGTGGTGSGGGGGHHGGAQEFASGTGYVPYDMLAKIHKGEIIIPPADSDRIRENIASGARGGDTYQNTWVMPEPPTRDPFEVLDRTARYVRWGRLRPEPG